MGSLAKIWAAKFFLQKSGSVTRYHGELSSCTISKGTNDLILRKLSDKEMDGETDRETDGRTDKRTRLISYDAVGYHHAPSSGACSDDKEKSGCIATFCSPAQNI